MSEQRERSDHLKNITPEQRASMLALAAEARENKKAYAQEHLKLSYDDEPRWRELSSKYNIRLPIYYIANSELKHLKRAMKKAGMCPIAYTEICGVKSLKQLVSLNPTWTALAEVGMMLETWDEMAV
ncbi:hypothetical protein D3C85_392790 [compost metagenome]